ncbi:MAG TPA: hypothetical protein VJ596_10480 [Gemmatimonadaceae bacterium]|nr:hypothetical protein [Gemmatimonadaceae bacterium]
MLEWLIPVSLFWILAAVLLGALPVNLVGGSGMQQILGLLLMYLFYLAVWGILHRLLGDDIAVRVIVPTVIATLALPVLAKLAFAIVRVRVVRDQSAAH